MTAFAHRYTWADAQMYDVRLTTHLDARNASESSGLGHPDSYGYVLYLWVLVSLLMANDIRKMKQFNRLLELPPQKSYHFFICKHVLMRAKRSVVHV